MKLSLIGRTTALAILLAQILSAQAGRIAGPIDDTRSVVLPGPVPRRALPGDDTGPVEPSFALNYLSLHAKPSPQQQQSLDGLLAELQDPSSPNYHRWLTPEEFGGRFGLSPGDMARIRAWLESQGFQVVREARGRNWIDFKGTAEQVGRAFHTQIHHYREHGEPHFANTTSPSIPAALAGIVSLVGGLDDFRPKPPVRRSKPRYTDLSGHHFLAPDDIATIYHLAPLYAANINGAGQSIAIAGQATVNLSDVAAFRTIFNLPANTPTVDSYAAGVTDADDVAEAMLDLEWSGAVARNATIVYVLSSNAIFDSVKYAIDGNLAAVISSSYTAGCDRLAAASNLETFEQYAQEANALGITWLSASGDTGAAGCEDNQPNNAPAVNGLAVNAPASVPEVTAVGGSEFVEGSGNYWTSINGANQGSALFYIPEMAWNDTTSTQLSAGGGGISAYYPIPSWQMALGLSGSYRQVPDVSLTASADHDGYIICDPTAPCPTQTWQILGDNNGGFEDVGGTSAATPVFAGILALLNHYMVAHGGTTGLGNINPTLYWLYQNNPSVFHDITTGNNIVPCRIGSTSDCTTGSIGYDAGPGYDRATGLGSVDGDLLVTAWAALPVPQVQSIAASAVTTNSATLAGSVNPNGNDTQVWFEYGASSSLTGSVSTTKQDEGFGATASAFSANIAGLTAGIPYYFEAWASSSAGTSHGAILSFTTAGVSTLPDLAVTSLTGPNVATPGGQISVVAKIANQGTAAAATFNLEFYFSTTPAISVATAIDTGWSCSNLPAEAVGASDTCSGIIGVPSSLTAGTWYLGAIADPDNLITELSKSNNSRAADTGAVVIGGTFTAPAVLGAGANGDLYSIVPVTGVTTELGALPAAMGDIAFYNGSLYGVSSATPSSLYKLNPQTGAGTLVGNTGFALTALAFNSSGTLYAAGGDSLYTVNTATGAATLVGSGSGAGTYNSDGDLEFDSTGKLYLSSIGTSSDQLFSINPATGNGALIGSIGYTQVRALAYYEGVLYGFTGGGEVLSLNVSTGVGTGIKSYSPVFSGAAVFAPPISPTITCSPSALSFTYTIGGTAPASETCSIATNPAGLTISASSNSAWLTAALSAQTTPATLTVSVATAGLTATTYNGTITVAGAGLISTVLQVTFTVVPAASLSIAGTHAGNFAQGQVNATYSLTVSNQSGVGATSGTVAVSDTIPTGLTLASMAGTGWTCTASSYTCTRSDSLAGGASYPVITVTASVSASSPLQVTNQASVSGGGSMPAASTDLTSITPVGSTFACQINAASTPSLRGEGYSELLGDIVISCTGGALLTTGSPVPTTSITVFIDPSVPITSRLLNSGAASEALLLIDEPGATQSSGVGPGFGPYAPQVACGNVTAGCPAYAGTSNGYPVAVSSAGGSTSAANVYQGVIGTYGANSVTFNAVPVLQPVAGGAARIFRIANIRVPTVGMAANSSLFVLGSALSSAVIPIPGSVVEVGVVGAFTTSKVAMAAAPFAQCQATPSPALTATVTFTEGFATAFKTRAVPLTNVAYAAQQTNSAAPYSQNIPGGLYSGFGVNSESHLIFPGFTGGGFTAGLADYGTRLKAVFSNIPAGVTLYVSTTSTNAPPSPAGGQSTSAYAVLVAGNTGEAASDGTVFAPITSGSPGSDSTAQIPLTAHPLAVNGSGDAVAVWEVVNANPSAIDSLSFSVYISYTPASGLPGLTGQSGQPVDNVALSFAPEPGGGTFSTSDESAGANIVPRFAITNPSSGSFVNIAACVPAPVLSIRKSHIGNLALGQTGAPYTVAVSNSGTAATSGTVTVTENVPTGLTLASMSGTGWTCPAGGTTCTRSDALAVGASYPAITVRVNVASNAPSSLTNQVTVSGGGSAAASASDVTTITAFSACDVNSVGRTTVSDIQKIVNESLGLMQAANDLNKDGAVNVGDTQITINAALSLGCAAQ